MKIYLPPINWNLIKSRLYQYYLLVRLNKPIGILLLLWSTLWALWVAGEGIPNIHVLVVFILGTIMMRSAGCIINDYADRNIDLHIARTQTRPITTGDVSTKEALRLFVVLCLIAFALVLTLNWLTICLSFVAVLLATIYPFAKRYTYLPQVVLGMAFAFAIPMAFAAQTGTVPKIAWLIYVITVIWVVVYDTMYAMVDREDDIKIGVKSTAILFGDADKVIIGILQGMMFLGLALLGKQLQLGTSYYLGLTVSIGLAIYQQYLISDRMPKDCFKAFLNNNWLGMAVFVGLVINYT